MSDIVLRPQSLVAFVKVQSAFGAPVFPAATDAVKLRSGIRMPSQPTQHNKLMEVGNSSSVVGLVRQLRAAGSLTLPFYLRPSGTAGTAPMEDPIVAAALGTHTNTPATSDAYTCAAPLTKGATPYSVWFGIDTPGSGGVVVGATDAVCTGLTLRQDKDGAVEGEATFEFGRLVWAGEGALDGAVDGDPVAVATAVVADSTLFAVGSFLKVGTDDNSGSGYRVTAVDRSTHTLTVTPSISTDQLDEAVVIPLALPTPTVVGSVLEERMEVAINGSNVNWQSWEWNFSQPATFYFEVPADPANADFASGFSVGDREITASVTAIMRTASLGYLAADDTDKSFGVDNSVNGTAGSLFTLSCPQGRYNVPPIEYGDPTVTVTLSFDAKASSGEDEASITYA